MINGSDPSAKSANDYLEHMRQKIGYGHSDKAQTRTAKKELDKDDFVKLMSVQLKYQDPTSPLKNEEMAAQLAQFSGLEQMQNVNRNLEKMSGANEVRDNMMAASLIGKRVETDGTKFKLTEDRDNSLKFELPADIERGKVSVVDAKGNVVRDLVLDNMPKGSQEIKWDGRNEKGTNADLGEYSFRVTAYDKAGKQVQAKTSSSGTITGIEFEKGKPVLLVGDARVYMDVVSKIENQDAPASGAAAKSPKIDPSAKPLPGAASSSPIAPKIGDAQATAAPASAAAATASETNPAPMSWPSQMNSGADSAPARESAASSEIARKSAAEADRPMIIEDRADPTPPEADGADVAATAQMPGMALWNPDSEDTAGGAL